VGKAIAHAQRDIRRFAGCDGREGVADIAIDHQLRRIN